MKKKKKTLRWREVGEKAEEMARALQSPLTVITMCVCVCVCVCVCACECVYICTLYMCEREPATNN